MPEGATCRPGRRRRAVVLRGGDCGVGVYLMRPAANGPRIEDLDILQVWTAAGGAPLRGNRGRAFWRNGDGYNISIDATKGTWYDHASGTGGGMLALVEIATGGDRRAALEWLGQNFGIATGGSYSPAERMEFARRRAAARAAAERLIERRDEAFNEIRQAKREKLEEYHRINGEAYQTEDIELLARAEDVWAELEALDDQGDKLLTETDAATLERLLSERRAA